MERVLKMLIHALNFQLVLVYLHPETIRWNDYKPERSLNPPEPEHLYQDKLQKWTVISEKFPILKENFVNNTDDNWRVEFHEKLPEQFHLREIRLVLTLLV